MNGFKIVRVHPETNDLVDTFSGRLKYRPGETVADASPHGLSVHRTVYGAISHRVPPESAGLSWPAVLIRVSFDPADVIADGGGRKKTLVRRLRVESVVRDVHPDIAQAGLSGHRLKDAEKWLADGWGGFREVSAVRRGAPSPEQIPPENRGQYVIECRPASAGRWSKPVVYRAVATPTAMATAVGR